MLLNNMNNGCGCNNNTNDDCSYDVTGINAQFGYNTVNMMNNDMDNNCTSCQDKRELAQSMLKDIRCLKFAITDLGLYLNNHPNDRKATCLWQEYSNRLNDLENKYQRMFGPLSIYHPCNSWRWLEEPWPWEGSEE